MTKLRGGAPAPSSPFALLPLRSGVVFPGTTLSLSVGRPRSLALLGTLQGIVIEGPFDTPGYDPEAVRDLEPPVEDAPTVSPEASNTWA